MPLGRPGKTRWDSLDGDDVNLLEDNKYNKEK
jgi:hypothetical protein